jgi:hypothetical protein
VDLTLLAGFGSEDSFILPLLSAYPARIDKAAEFARTYRTLLLSASDGVGINVSLGALPFEECAVSRATLFSFGHGLEVRTYSAEDLIIFKLCASHPLDIRDAESIAIRNHDQLDWSYIEEHLRSLVEVKGDPEIIRTMLRLRQL